MIQALTQYFQIKVHRRHQKVMDVISRLVGQAADATSAYTQVEMEHAPSLLKIPKSECPYFWIRLPKHKWPKSWSSMEDLVAPLERNLYGHPLAGLLWERQLEKVLLKHGWEKIPNWECLFVHREKGLFLSVYVDDIKIGWKETKSCSDVETTQQRSWFGRTNIFPGSCILGLHSTTMQNKQRYCGQVQNHVRIANFSGVNRKTHILPKYSYFFMVVWHGGSCKEVWGTILWVGKQEYTTTLRFWVLCSIHWARIFSISNDSRQDHGYHLQIARLRWRSSGRSISLYPSK